MSKSESTLENGVKNPYLSNGYSPVLFHPEGENLSLITSDPIHPDTQRGLRDFISIVRQPKFPCIGAKQTISHTGTFMMGSYDDMASIPTAEAISHDVMKFLEHSRPDEIGKSHGLKPTSFSAFFPNQQFEGELDACRQMLALVKNLLELDVKNFSTPSDPVLFSRNVEDPNFAVCVGGHPFFTAFFHAHKDSASPRKTDSGVYVNFNSHHGFYYLKGKVGVHERWLDIIRGNIERGYGPPHPDLVHHGLWSEVMQYLTVSELNRDAAIKMIGDVFGLAPDCELFKSLSEMRTIIRERATAAGCPYHV